VVCVCSCVVIHDCESLSPSRNNVSLRVSSLAAPSAKPNKNAAEIRAEDTTSSSRASSSTSKCNKRERGNECVCIYDICIYIYIYVYIYIYMSTHTHTCMYVCIHI